MRLISGDRIDRIRNVASCFISSAMNEQIVLRQRIILKIVTGVNIWGDISGPFYF